MEENKIIQNWTEEEKAKLTKLCSLLRYSFKELGEMLNKTPEECRLKMRELGLKSHYTCRKYTFDENFWETPNEINSYFAGFSTADAYVRRYKNSNGTEYSLKIQLKDENHVKRFIQEINYNGTLKYNSRKSPKSDTMCHTVGFSIHSRKWLDDLERNFGIVQNKTNHIISPNLNKDLLFRFLVGYIDGDGNIMINKETKNATFQFVSASLNFIEWIRNYMNSYGDRLFHGGKTTNKIVKSKQGNYYTFAIGGLKVAQFINHVNSLGFYCLDRKWKSPLALDSVAHYKNKFPKHFENLPNLV